MPKDILLYGALWEYNAMFFHHQINESLKDDANADLALRINCRGGSPEFGMGTINKIQETPNFVRTLVEGEASSMAFFALCCLKDVEAIETAQFVVHRAAYGDWIETSPSFKGSVHEESLAKTNKDLEKMFRAAVDVEAFENLTQVKAKNLKVKDIFSMEGRVEILLSAADMKKIGLVHKIIRITPAKTAEIKSLSAAFENCASLEQFQKAAEAVNLPAPKQQSKVTNMTLEEFRAQHPEVFQSAVNVGVNQERDRVGAWLPYQKIDAEAVVKGIKEGRSISESERSEFAVKALNPEALKKVADGNAPDVSTTEVVKEKTEEETKKDAEKQSFEKDLRNSLGLNQEKK